jgi:hypothetical protein
MGWEMGRVTFGDGPVSICLAAGIHGNEPAGAEALVRFLEAVGDGRFASQVDLKPYTFLVLPCNNPSGYERGTRENGDGIDLNREFGNENPPAEAARVVEALRGRRFDLFVDFHEDTDGEGMYLYEIFRDGAWGQPIGPRLIDVLSKHWPIDPRDEVDGFPNRHGIISPEFPLDRNRREGGGLPLPVYLYFEGVPHCITLETPTRLPFEDRVRVHLEGLETILTHIGGVGVKNGY